ncbi:hypothetical protein HGG72_15860 [Ochrobactrum pecoris]|uniref:Twin-arginine translocation signal domain-containing protein n=1 Tax=Brucella pecoris TaxID=867683 RepID=A0A5C5CLP1_9HYPH|nr:hypothetical protein [Brucella pecoris]MBB4094381.1 hypothetical protein [Brucella pecoris]NKW81455.1 hypothetical protein [Brucella pecoris]TNV12044.1 hypothetical protein FIB18_11410 [Brucella pecoris]
MGDTSNDHSLLSSGFSRRNFLKASITTGIGLTFGQWQTGAALADETPKRGGHLKLGLSGGASTDSLDSATYMRFPGSAPDLAGCIEAFKTDQMKRLEHIPFDENFYENPARILNRVR